MVVVEIHPCSKYICYCLHTVGFCCYPDFDHLLVHNHDDFMDTPRSDSVPLCVYCLSQWIKHRHRFYFQQKIAANENASQFGGPNPAENRGLFQVAVCNIGREMQNRRLEKEDGHPEG